jgi:hypothetical protein
MTTSGKIAWATLATVGIASAVAVGVIYGPRMMQHDEAMTANPPAVEAPATNPDANAKPRHAAKATPKASTADTNAKRTIAPDVVPKLPATEPELQTRLKPVLNKGTRMADAAEGFKDGVQFAAVAHGARNTQIPFVLLKHRVLDERKTLAQAIEASRPDLDGQREARRAYDAARFDVAVITDADAN